MTHLSPQRIEPCAIRYVSPGTPTGAYRPGVKVTPEQILAALPADGKSGPHALDRIENIRLILAACDCIDARRDADGKLSPALRQLRLYPV
jgi:hypothetical protein